MAFTTQRNWFQFCFVITDNRCSCWRCGTRSFGSITDVRWRSWWNRAKTSRQRSWMAAWSRSVNLAAVSLGCLLGRIAELRRCGYCYRRSSAISLLWSWALQNRLKWSRYHLYCGFRWALGTVWRSRSPHGNGQFWGQRAFVRSFRAGVQPTLDSRS